jgi:hypothetical protein
MMRQMEDNCPQFSFTEFIMAGSWITYREFFVLNHCLPKYIFQWSIRWHTILLSQGTGKFSVPHLMRHVHSLIKIFMWIKQQHINRVYFQIRNLDYMNYAWLVPSAQGSEHYNIRATDAVSFLGLSHIYIYIYIYAFRLHVKRIQNYSELVILDFKFLTECAQQQN